MKILKTLAALAFALSPTIAFANPPNHTATAHMRPNLVRTRTIQARTNTEIARPR